MKKYVQDGGCGMVFQLFFYYLKSRKKKEKNIRGIRQHFLHVKWQLITE